MEKEIIEKLADIEHQRWADWQRWVHINLKETPAGLFLPRESVNNWDKQIQTDYKDLSEFDKEKDREQVRRYLPIIRGKIQEDLLVKCECEDGGCPNCLRLCKLIDELN
jgi:hypothetical protein